MKKSVAIHPLPKPIDFSSVVFTIRDMIHEAELGTTEKNL